VSDNPTTRDRERKKIYYFPLTANPLGSGGTFGGTFNFTGYQVTP